MSALDDRRSRWTDLVPGALLVAGPPAVGFAVALAVGANRAVTGILVLLGALAAVTLERLLVMIPMSERMARSRLDAENLRLELLAERGEAELRGRLERAMVMTSTESEALLTGLRAVGETAPDHRVSLLLSVPGAPSVGWQIRLEGSALEPAEPIEGAPECAALRTGRTTTAAASSALGACAHLHTADLEVSALCIPLHVDDRLLGVVCVQGPPGGEPGESTTRRMRWIVERTGIRVAERRRLLGPAVHDNLDPSTGLPGAETLRLHLRDLVRSLSPFCVAVVEVDSLGADGAGDSNDALALIADVLRSTLRPDDLICRLDGPRVAAVLVNCSAEQATAAAERTRESLALELAEFESARPVTFSAGVVESHRANSLDEIVRLAIDACEASIDAGGNRVTISDGT